MHGGISKLGDVTHSIKEVYIVQFNAWVCVLVHIKSRVIVTSALKVSLTLYDALDELLSESSKIWYTAMCGVTVLQFACKSVVTPYFYD